jgi:uncharacterized protein YndB with AHSA1/START domain
MSLQHPLGEIIRDGDRVGLRYERRLNHRPERVWRALTDSDQLQHWLPCDIVGPRTAGATIQLPFWPAVADKYNIEEPTLSGTILTWDPPRTFSWMWDTDELTFELEPFDGGTVLTFTTWIDKGPGLASTGAGYHVCFDQLADLLDTDRPAPFIDQDPAPYERIYESAFASQL